MISPESQGRGKQERNRPSGRVMCESTNVSGGLLMNKGTSKREKKQESREMENRCWEFLKPFLEELDKRLDRRLVQTLLDLVLVILMHRHRNNG